MDWPNCGEKGGGGEEVYTGNRVVCCDDDLIHDSDIDGKQKPTIVEGDSSTSGLVRVRKEGRRGVVCPFRNIPAQISLHWYRCLVTLHRKPLKASIAGVQSCRHFHVTKDPGREQVPLE